MRLAELESLMRADEATQAADMATALGQATIAVGPGWNPVTDGAVCECGILLVALPRPVWVRRAIVVAGRAASLSFRMDHAHLADMRCMGCWESGPCPVPHAELMCDMPQAVGCGACDSGVAVPGRETCGRCAVRAGA